MSRGHEIRKQRGHTLRPGINVDRLLGRALGMVPAKEVLRERLRKAGLGNCQGGCCSPAHFSLSLLSLLCPEDRVEIQGPNFREGSISGKAVGD